MALVDVEKCVGCGNCRRYCPMGAITVENDKAVVNQDECVECGLCFENRICPTGALHRPENLVWPRNLRESFSNPRCITWPDELSDINGSTGRGTEEMKTNDITNRYPFGKIGIAVELGRPCIGARFRDFERVSMALSEVPGIVFEKANPVNYLYVDQKTHKMREDILNEKVLTGIIEVLIPEEELPTALQALKKVEPELDSICSVDLISRVQPDGSIPALDVARSMGVRVSPNCKTNIGLGKL